MFLMENEWIINGVMLKQIKRRGIDNLLGNRQIKTGLQSWLLEVSFPGTFQGCGMKKKIWESLLTICFKYL